MKYAVALLAVIAVLLGYQFVYKDYAFRRDAIAERDRLLIEFRAAKPGESNAVEQLDRLHREVIRRNGGVKPSWW